MSERPEMISSDGGPDCGSVDIVVALKRLEANRLNGGGCDSMSDPGWCCSSSV